MQRRSERIRTASEAAATTAAQSAEKDAKEKTPPLSPSPAILSAKRPGRRRGPSVQPSPDTKPDLPICDGSGDMLQKIVLNARGMPARQRKRNRYYDDEDDINQRTLAKKFRPPPEKKIKLEPLQILLDNPANSNNLQVTPIISDSDFPETEIPIEVVGKKSTVRLVAHKTKVESGIQIVSIESDKEKKSSSKPIANKLVTKSHSAKETSKLDTGVNGKPKNEIIVNRRSDHSSFIRFFANVKSKVIMPDRWGINGVMFDPVVKMKTFTLCEMDISPVAEVRIKKCLQVFEDLSVKVVIQGRDLTTKIDGLKKLHSDLDVPGIVQKVAALKVCAGVKNFQKADLNYHPSAKKNGSSYFSSDCQTVLPLNFVGALCPACSRLRNSIRRRRLKLKQEREKASALPVVKNLSNPFARGVFSLLNQLMTDEKSKKRTTKALLGQEFLEGATTSSTNPRRTPAADTKAGRRSEQRRRKRQEMKLANAARQMSISHVLNQNPGLSQTLLADGRILDYVTLARESGNIVIQNGGEFTFADGQEYEIIGEANPVQPIQLMETPSEQTIQIIEVDDQTMAQFAAQNLNMSSLFFHDPSNIQVTEIDPNDPNAVFKVLNSGEIYVHEDKK